MTKLHISRENRKLRPNERTAFIIWNLPAVITCPNRTKLCERFCYARKAERVYPQVMPSRMENFEASKQADFSERMTAEIMRIAKGTRKAEIIVRIHESGDFYNREYAEKWLAIMENCKANKRIKFIAYTKSFRFFDGIQLPDNFSLRASIWSDTKPEDIETIARNNWSIYTAVESFTASDSFTHCHCKDCATCGLCWSKAKDIRCEIH